jgi:hypothetical protein
LVAWLCGITLYRGPNLPSPIALIYAGAATLTPLGIGRSRMSKIKEVMLLALVADGSIELKIADAGKVVNTIYDALKANGLLVASGKKNKKRKSK